MRIADKEEELVLDDWPAERPALIVADEDWPPDAARVVEPVVGVERRIFMLPKHLAVPGIRARSGDELNLNRALPGAIGAEVRSGDGHFLDALQAGLNEGKEAGTAALETLSVVGNAVERDVERRAGQAVDGAVARGHALLGARREQHKRQRAAARQRQVLQIFL